MRQYKVASKNFMLLLLCISIIIRLRNLFQNDFLCFSLTNALYLKKYLYELQLHMYLSKQNFLKIIREYLV